MATFFSEKRAWCSWVSVGLCITFWESQHGWHWRQSFMFFKSVLSVSQIEIGIELHCWQPKVSYGTSVALMDYSCCWQKAFWNSISYCSEVNCLSHLTDKMKNTCVSGGCGSSSCSLLSWTEIRRWPCLSSETAWDLPQAVLCLWSENVLPCFQGHVDRDIGGWQDGRNGSM